MKRTGKRISLALIVLLLVGSLTACQVDDLVAAQGTQLAELESRLEKLENQINETNQDQKADQEVIQESNGLAYIVDKENGLVTIKGRGLCTSTDIVIPETLEGYPVTTIQTRAFQNDSDLKSITLPNSVTSIGNYAFYGCTGLTSVTIPDSVTSIENGAFYGCTGLTSITIPDSVTSIENGAFEDCTGLTNVTIPNSVTSIGNFAFSGCTGLTSITIPESVTSIGVCAFSDWTGLTSITIPDSVTSIGKNAFYDCSSLTNITIPDSVTSIGDEAFSNCKKLNSIKFQGTKAQWNAISKGSNWNYNTGKYTITCTDGTISK